MRFVVFALIASSLLLAACASDTVAPDTEVFGSVSNQATASPTAEPSHTAAATLSTASASATPTPAPPTPTQSPGGTATTSLRVYFLRDEKIATATRIVPKTQQVGTAAMEELLKGPVDAERASGFSTTVPPGTQLLGLNIKDSLATVNLSKEFESGGGSFSVSARLAQVVYTLTQFSSVTRVELQIAGEAVKTFSGEGLILDQPMDRDTFEQWTPLILVESPTMGAAVGEPVRVTGTANTFEATFTVAVLGADGATLAEETVTATSGSGVRGTFDVTIPYQVSDPGQGSIVVYALSPKDGSRLGEVTIPVQLGP